MVVSSGAFLQSDSAVEIFQMSDFQAPVAGVISLENKTYNINQALTSSDRFNVPAGVSPKFLGTDHTRNSFTYTGTGSMFSGTDIGGFDVTELSLTSSTSTVAMFDFNFTGVTFASIFIKNQNISGPSGDVFNISAPFASGGFMTATNVSFSDCMGLGSISGMGGVSFIEDVGFDIGQGMVFSNCGQVTWSLENFLGGKNLVGSTAIDLQSGVLAAFIINSAFAIGSNESVMNIDSSLSSSMIVVSTVNTSSDGGTFFKAGSLDETNFDFLQNVGITPSTVRLSETTTPTSVSGIGRIYTKSDNNLYFQDAGGTENTLFVKTPEQNVTIASGAITVTSTPTSSVIVDTEDAASTDDLETINGGTTGDMIVISPADSSRSVRITEAGNINMKAPINLSLGSVNDTFSLIRKGSSWDETSRSING